MTWSIYMFGTTPFYFGTSGYDHYAPTAEARNVFVYGNAGNDLIFAGAGNDFISGGSDDDNLNGGDGSDTVNGDSGDDHVFTSKGMDTLDGGTGLDTLLLSSTTLPGTGWSVDLLTGQASQVYASFEWNGNTFQFFHSASVSNFEAVTGSWGDDTISGDHESNVIKDAPAHLAHDDDYITARGGDDTISLLGGGDDTVFGGAGDDRIEVRGTSTNADFWGDSGKDTFVFQDNGSLQGRVATIHDFNIGDFDQIELAQDLVHDTDGGGIQGQKSFWITQVGQDATIHVDRNGDTTEDYAIDVFMVAGGMLTPSYDFV